MTALKGNQESPQKGTVEDRQRALQIDQRALKTSTASPQKGSKTPKPTIVWISSDEEDEGEGLSKEDSSDDEWLTKKLQDMSVTGVSVKSTRPSTPVQRVAPNESVSHVTPTPSTPTPSTPTQTMGAKMASASPVPTPFQAPATPGRQGKFNAYVVYSGKFPYYYAQWAPVKALFAADKNLVFKGFWTLEQAKAAYDAARDSGVIKAIRVGAGRPIWSVTEGVRPAVYSSVHDALREGLEWGPGHLKGFADEADAAEDWDEKSSAKPSRIVATPSPGFF
ncbi:hypothetical protein FB446DRAFT_706044 [Lentinula raphanica]|nr:hypothetical protein FB446DRAFT_706044 [Lentinula raphanica]